MKKRLMVVSAVLLVLTGTAAIAAVAATARVNVRTTSLGKILVTAQGHTLYFFAPDKRGKSTCYGSCATYWPPLLVTGKPTAGTGLKASLLGVTIRKDGKRQVTYNGHPLYTYVGDRAAGKTSGEGLNLSGGFWWVVSPAGRALKTRPRRQAAATEAAATATDGPHSGVEASGVLWPPPRLAAMGADGIGPRQVTSASPRSKPRPPQRSPSCITLSSTL